MVRQNQPFKSWRHSDVNVSFSKPQSRIFYLVSHFLHLLTTPSFFIFLSYPLLFNFSSLNSSPLHPSQLLTKRILALPGDVIRVPTPNSSSSSSSKPIFTRIKIPDGHAWVEGDSSSNERTGIGKSGGSLADKSRDSREFGPVS